MTPKLSLCIPVKNEQEYVLELIKSFDSLFSDSRFQFIFSDNCSTDSTKEIIRNQIKGHKNAKLLEASSPITPFENHLKSFHASEGQYVFFCGGDDLINSSKLKEIVNLLNNKEIYFFPFDCFDDATGSTFLQTCIESDINFLVDKGKLSLKKYINNINYDQMIFNISKRELLLGLTKICPNSIETFAVWSVIFQYYYSQKIVTSSYINSSFFKKRYNKIKISGNFALEQGYSNDLMSLKAICTIKNSFILFKSGQLKFSDLFLLIFSKRKKIELSKNGLLFSPKRRHSFSPIFYLFLSPLYFFKWVTRSRK